MDDITLRIIKDSAFEFRNAIEQLESNEHPNSSWFAEYPKGCCGDTSDLLAKFLLANGIRAEYVWGMCGKQSHAWLETNGYIIDITADQFEDVNERVIVTTDKSFHSRFKVQKRSYNDFTKYKDYNSARLGTIYNNVLKRIGI